MTDDAMEHKPKLLVISTTYPRWDGDNWPGFVHELSSRLTKQYQVTVLSPRQPGVKETEIRDDVRIVRFAYLPRRLELLSGNDGIFQTLRSKPWLLVMLPMFFIGMMLAIRRQLVSNVNLIHAHWLPWGLLATLAAPKTPVLITTHGSDVFKLRGSFWRSFRRMTARRARLLAVVSERLANNLVQEGVAREKIELAPMGVDLQNRFSVSKDALKTYGMIFVGRLVAAKGPDLLVDAMPALLRHSPDATLTMVGDGPLADQLKIRAKAYGIEHAVLFSTAQSNAKIAELMAAAKVCVMPGRSAADGVSEGLGLVAIEALGVGCRLVSGSNPALQEMLPDGAPAIFVDPENTDEFAMALSAALSKSSPLDEAGFQKFRDLLVKKFDWDSVVQTYDTIIQKCML